MNTHHLVKISLLIAVALSLSFIETLIPLPFPIPGAKLGLTNIVTLYMLGEYRLRDIFLVVLARVLLVGFLFGSLSSILYALAGSLTSLLIMAVLYKFKFHIILVSIMGGISHNFGQLIVACLVTNTWLLFISYGLYLLLFGFLTGLFNGWVVVFLKKYLPA